MATSIAAFPRLNEAEKAMSDGRLEAASTLVIQHLRAHPNEPRGLALLGSIAFKGGALVQAEQFLRQAISLGAGTLPVQRELASILHHQERLSEALALLSALEQRIADPAIRGSKSLIFDKLGRNDESLR